MNDLAPTEFYLGQNYPNPFKDKTIIKNCVAYKTKVKITVFDSQGEMIEKLVDEEQSETIPLKFRNEHSLSFNIINTKLIDDILLIFYHADQV